MAKMDIKERKRQLHDLIDNVEDPELLDLYWQLLAQFGDINNYTMQATDGEIKAIKESLEAIDKFGVISNEDALKRLKARFPNLSFK